MELIVIIAAMLLVGFDFGVYIIGALIIWRFIVMVEVHPQLIASLCEDV